MKKTKRFASLLLALVMVFAMAITASATEATPTTYSITVTGKSGHTYEVYQIFTGDLSGNVLSNIVWGDGVTSAGQTELGDAAAVADTLEDTADAKAFAQNIDIKDYLTNPTTMTAGTEDENGNVVYTVTGLEPGYYLIKDKDATQDVDNGAYTAYILKVVKDVEATPKDSVPEVDKNIEGAGEATDVNIGDTVTFTLTATLGDDISEFEEYIVVFQDTLSEGLTFKEYVSATLDGEDVKENFEMTQDNSAGEGPNLFFECQNVIPLGAENGSVIVITYTATLNENAVIGKDGNSNKVYLEYSNNPNDGGGGTTKTPEDEVLVFTYELDVTKVDGADADTKLKDAEFVLYRGEGENVEYVKVNAEGKVIGWTTDKTQASTLTSDANGLFKVIGLDAGTYYLEETKAPEGYNKLTNPITVVITATVNSKEDTPALEALEIKVDDGNAVDGDLNTGIVSTNVENNQGATLPETGGTGTTVFYILGGILMVAAAILLVTKRRMNANR